MFPPQPLILLWWCHMAVMQPHLPTFSLVAPAQDQLLCLSWCSVHFALMLFLSSPELEKMDVTNSLQFPGNSIFLPSSLTLYCLLSPSPLISLSLSLSLYSHNPSSMWASPHLLLLCCAAHIRSPPSLPFCPALSIRGELWTIFITSLWLCAHGPGGAAVFVFSAPESSQLAVGKHLGCVDSRLLITQFCTLMQDCNMLRLVTKSFWFTREPVAMLAWSSRRCRDFVLTYLLLKWL